MNVRIQSMSYEAGPVLEGYAGVRGVVDDGALAIVMVGSSLEVFEYLKQLEAETKRAASVEVKATFRGAQLGAVAERIARGGI